MTTEEVIALFEKHEDLYGFKHVTNRRSNRADLHAFLLLDSLVPETPGKDYAKDIVSCAEHDEFWVSVDLDDLAKAGITEDQVKELIYCGARVDEFQEGLCFHV